MSSSGQFSSVEVRVRALTATTDRTEAVKTIGLFLAELEKGTIRASEALPQESNEPHLADRPRLRLWFDRRSLGRLRQMIDVMNQEG